MNNQITICLPTWIWDKATNNDEFKDNLAKYMRRYPRYRVIKVTRYQARCEILR